MRRFSIAVVALLSFVSNCYAPGWLVMMPYSDQASRVPGSTWQVIDPYNNDITSTICGSTQSQCEAEFIAYWASTGLPAKILGPGTNYGAAGPQHIDSTVPIPIPPATSADLEILATTVFTFSGSYQGPGYVIDSQIPGVHISFRQTLCYWSNPNIPSPTGVNFDHNSSFCILKYPHTATPAGQPSIAYGTIDLGIIVANSTNPNIVPANAQNGTSWAYMAAGAVGIDGEAGTIFDETMSCVMLNGSNTAQYGLLVFNNTMNWGALTVSRVNCPYVESTMRVGVSMGTGSTNATQMSGNVLNFGDIEIQAGLAVNDFGWHNDWGPTAYPSNPSVTPNWTMIVQGGNEHFRCTEVQSAYSSGQVLDVSSGSTFENCGTVVR